MTTSPRSFLASHRDDASRLVKRVHRFSVRIPVVGKVSLPSPDQLAFYGALGVLAALSVVDWPVALAIGAGAAVVAHEAGTRAGGNDSVTKTRVEVPARPAEHGNDKPGPQTVAPQKARRKTTRHKSASA